MELNTLNEFPSGDSITSQKTCLVSISLTGCSPCVLLLTKWDLNTQYSS